MLEEVETTWSEFTNEKRWFLQFFVSILLCINNAACFCFGIFSPFMKLGGFRYSQSQLMTVSTVGVLLSYFSLPTGYLYDLKGPKATILVGTVLNVLGWFGMYCIFYDLEHPLWSNSVFVMCIFYGFSQLSASFYETGSVLTNLRSFNCYQGRVILIQKTFMGLGSSIVAQIYIAFFQLNITGIAPFFAFLFTFSAVSGILGVLFVSLPTESTRCVGLNVADPEIGPTGGETKLFSKPFNYGTVVLLVGVVYVLVVTLYENHADLSPAYRAFVGVSTVTLCLLFIGMTFLTPSYKVNVGGYRGDTQEGEEDMKHIDASERLPVEDPSSGKTYGAEGQVTESPVQPAEEEAPAHSTYFFFLRQSAPIVLNKAPLTANLMHREVWLLWLVCFASWSSMTLVSSNSSQVYQAVDYDHFSFYTNTVYVSIFGVASALGRVLVGFAHPYLMKEGYFIGSLLSIPPLFNLIGLPLFLIIPTALLFLPFFIVGFSAGVSWGSTVLVVTSLFQSNNCGKHYSWLYTAGMLSPVVFNMCLFGPLYDSHSRSQGRTEDNSCKGVECIAVSFILCAVLNAVAVPAAYHLCRRVVERCGALA